MLDHYFLKSSRIFTLLLVAMLGLVTISVWLTNFYYWWRLVLVMVVWLGVLDVFWREVLLRHASSWQFFSLTGRQLQVRMRRGEEVHGEVMPCTIVTSLCVVLWVRPQQGAPVKQVIFRDALPEGAFRELCVRLKYC